MQGLHTGPSGDWHADSSAPARRLQPHDPSRRPVDPPLPAVEREVEEAIRPLLEVADAAHVLNQGLRADYDLPVQPKPNQSLDKLTLLLANLRAETMNRMYELSNQRGSRRKVPQNPAPTEVATSRV